ncbi:MAG TPA: MlaD family protein [Vicinamibacterales bacterium]|nr:MlaD family protein [Vicinamibacterales bacterium]
MPRTRSLAWAELKIGLVGLVALVLTAALILAVGGEGGFFWQRYELKTKFRDVRGLKPGAVVRVAGVEVGRVTHVRFAGPEVEVVMEIAEDMRPLVTTASRASIGSLSLLGEPVIDITPASEGSPLPPGGYVPPGRASGQITDVAEAASQGLEQATALLAEIRRGRGTVGRLFTDDALYREVQRFVEAASDVASRVSQGRGSLGRLVQDPQAARQLEASLANLEAITRQINSGQGSLGRLLRDRSLEQSLASIGGNLEAVTGRLSRGEGTAGRLLADDELYRRVNDLAGRLDRLSARLADGQGTAGLLLQDRRLYENMNAAATELRSLIADIRKDPKRYLNVRVSIF